MKAGEKSDDEDDDDADPDHRRGAIPGHAESYKRDIARVRR